MVPPFQTAFLLQPAWCHICHLFGIRLRQSLFQRLQAQLPHRSWLFWVARLSTWLRKAPESPTSVDPGQIPAFLSHPPWGGGSEKPREAMQARLCVDLPLRSHHRGSGRQGAAACLLLLLGAFCQMRG